MTEFDFDELDKAVNSLMKNTPGDDTVAATEPAPLTSVLEPEPTTVVLDPAPSSESVAAATDTIEEPDVSRLVSPIQTPAEPTESKPQPPTQPYKHSIDRDGGKSMVTKRRGTFMDVVHPSSDMRNRQGSSTRATPKRETVLAPIDSSSEDETDNDESVMHQPETTPQVVVPRSADDVELASTLTDAASREVVAPSSPETDLTAVEDVPQADYTPVSMSQGQEASTLPADVAPVHESLFIADAKVEKRPLGPQPDTISIETQNDQPVSDLPQAPVSSRLPDELSGGVMAVESEKETTRAQAPLDNPTEGTSAESVPRMPVPAASAATVVAAPIVSQGTTTASSEGDHPAIYDPSYYQQETKPKTKKKSGWWVIFAITGLIILGGAGGVLYYFYTTNSF